MCQELKVIVKDNTTNGPYDWLMIQLVCRFTDLTFYIKTKGPKSYVLHIISHDHNQRLFRYSIHVSIRDKNWLAIEHAVLELIRRKLLKISFNQFGNLLTSIATNRCSRDDLESDSFLENDEI